MTHKLITAPSNRCPKIKRGKLTSVKPPNFKRYAKNHGRFQWPKLQQVQPDDFVTATGVRCSMRQFIEWTAAKPEMLLRWDGQCVNEVGCWQYKPTIKTYARHIRLSAAEIFLGDPPIAKQKLGWVQALTAQALFKEMVANDLVPAKQHALLKANRYSVNVSVE